MGVKEVIALVVTGAILLWIAYVSYEIGMVR